MSKFFCFVVCLCLAIGCSSDSNIGTVPFELSDPNADVTITVDDKPIQVTSLRQPFKFTVGDHELRAEGARYETIERTWQVVSGVNPVFKIDLIPVKTMAEASATLDSTPDTERVPGSGVSEDVAETEPPKEESIGDSIDSSEKEQQASTSPAEDLIALTPKEMELIQWAQQEKGAIVMPGEGLGLVFPFRVTWNNDDMGRFRDLPHVHTLMFAVHYFGRRIDGTDLNDDQLLRLSGLPELETIGVQGSRITDRSMEHLARFPIKDLSIKNASITDDGLSFFFRHRPTDLRLLNCQKVGDQGLLSMNLSGVKLLNVRDTGVSDRFMASLQHIPELRVLDISRTRVSGKGLLALKGCSNLVDLRAVDVPLQDDHLHLLDNRHAMTILDISQTHVTTAGVQVVAANFPKLSNLMMRDLSISASRSIDWSRMQNLSVLNFGGNHIGNRQLQSFTVMKKLKSLVISTEPKFFTATREGLHAFKQALPDCTINNKSVDELIHELSQ